MDYQFLALVAQIMPHLNVKTDRAMSNLLGQHDNFISRIKTGVQSVPSTVWDIFNEIVNTSKFKLLTENQHDKKNKAVSHIITKALLSNIPSVEPETPAREFETNYKKDLETANEKIMLLTSQLADKERLIQILLDQVSKK